jgi:hypothetical protein
MNQKVVIYIILSAILLYLYYKRGALAIFAAFVAVVAGTIFTQGSASEREGFGFGGGKGGDKVDSACAKLGFKPIKLDKDDLAGTLEQVIKNIENVAAKHWPYDIRGETEDKEKRAKLQTFIKVYQKKAKAEFGDNEKKEGQANGFVFASFNVYEKKRYNELVAEKPELFKQIVSGGEINLKILEKISKSDEIDSDFKNTLKYLICLCKQWTNTYKAIQKVKDGGGGGGGGDEADDEEEKPKKKKKTKPTKKKKSSKKKDDEDDEDADADADEDDE